VIKFRSHKNIYSSIFKIKKKKFEFAGNNFTVVKKKLKKMKL